MKKAARAGHVHCDAPHIVTVASRSVFGVGMLAVFVGAQLCDGVLTYVGVSTFGHEIEANPIVAWYIAVLGAGVALFAVKTLAIGCALLLYRFAHYRTIGALAIIYLTMAVHPWVNLLLSR